MQIIIRLQLLANVYVLHARLHVSEYLCMCVCVYVAGCTLCLLSHCLSTLLAESGTCSVATVKNSCLEPPSVCSSPHFNK